MYIPSWKVSRGSNTFSPHCISIASLAIRPIYIYVLIIIYIYIELSVIVDPWHMASFHFRNIHVQKVVFFNRGLTVSLSFYKFETKSIPLWLIMHLHTFCRSAVFAPHATRGHGEPLARGQHHNLHPSPWPYSGPLLGVNCTLTPDLSKCKLKHVSTQRITRMKNEFRNSAGQGTSPLVKDSLRQKWWNSTLTMDIIISTFHAWINIKEVSQS